MPWPRVTRSGFNSEQWAFHHTSSVHKLQKRTYTKQVLRTRGEIHTQPGKYSAPQLGSTLALALIGSVLNTIHVVQDILPTHNATTANNSIL